MFIYAGCADFALKIKQILNPIIISISKLFIGYEEESYENRAVRVSHYRWAVVISGPRCVKTTLFENCCESIALWEECYNCSFILYTERNIVCIIN